MEIEKLDVKGKMCPMPVAFTKRKLESMASGQLLEVIGEGKLEFDNIQRWVKNNGHKVVESSILENEFRMTIRKHQA
ncbi:MAG TPA: sulfurtransferase TusA family protein [Candidatus Acidoferrum sp.]|nr:sulfurtransferase TusA family protein [Candidatus Acidoferrum sp.]